MRVGNGPMDSCFHYAIAARFRKQILRPVLGSKVLGMKDRVKGASLRLLKQSAMRRMLFFGGEQPDVCAVLQLPLYHPAKCSVFDAVEKHIVKGVSKHDPDNVTAMDTYYALFCPGEFLKCIIMPAGYTGMDYHDFQSQCESAHQC